MYSDKYEKNYSNLKYCKVGARKQQNIKENICVLNAVMSDAVNGTKEAIDIAVYDVEKCFDFVSTIVSFTAWPCYFCPSS